MRLQHCRCGEREGADFREQSRSKAVLFMMPVL